jgi:hypothetical protein
VERHTGKEKNTQKGGKSGVKVKIRKGPAAGGSTAGNPTPGGKIKLK